MIGGSKLLLVVPAALDAVQDEKSPGNELEDDGDNKACKSGVVSAIFLRGAIVIIAPALVQVGEITVGAVRGVGVP